MSADAPPLGAELLAGLRRLKLATMRAQGPEVLHTARTQRWPPEEVLRVLVAAEIAARERSNQQLRLKAAGFPVPKRLDDFDTLASSVPPATFAYVATLEWVRAHENLLLLGPAGTGKSHLLVGVGLRAVERGLRVRYVTAAELVEQLYRGLADNTVSRIIDGLLRNDVILIDEVGFAPFDETGTQLLFRLVAAVYERRSLGLASHWPFEDWGTFLPVPSTAAALLDRLLHHSVVVVTSGESWRLKEARARAHVRLAAATTNPGTTTPLAKEGPPTP
jgi:DNA replication protein DnaC